jgi:hypothetical protein
MMAGLACMLTACVAGCTSDNRASVGDGGAACIDFDLSAYDKSCQEDSNCIAALGGMICDPDCLCGGSAAITADAEALYNAALSAAGSSLPRGPVCSCLGPLGSPTVSRSSVFTAQILLITPWSQFRRAALMVADGQLRTRQAMARWRLLEFRGA